MIGCCEEFQRLQEISRKDGDAAARWRRHLDGCETCREQEATDALLRAMSRRPVPELSGTFEERLRSRLRAEDAAARRAPSRRPRGLRPAAVWVLGAYGTAAAAASILVLMRLPWRSLAVTPSLGIALGALALLSPLILLDRVGVVRPPG